MKKSIIINIISWLGISLLLFFYLERQLAFHYFYIEQFRLFRFGSVVILGGLTFVNSPLCIHLC